MKISVIIPCYNYGKYLAEAIESVLGQTYPAHEVIIVDDGSTDNSTEVCNRYKNSILLLGQRNLGVAAARNAGAKISTGDVLSFLDADDYWNPEKLGKEVEVFTGGVVSTAMREFRDLETISIRKAAPLGWVAAHLQKGKAVVSGSSFSVKREVFDHLGGFDESRNIHPSEDWDFLFRASQICQMTVVDEPLVNYRNHGNNAHLKIRSTEKSMKAVFLKIFGGTVDRESYGNLYSILAGSYFYAKEYRKFLISAVKAIYYRPALLKDRFIKS